MTAAPKFSEIDYADVQGLVRFGFGKLTDACYLLVKIRSASAARQWIASAPFTTAEFKAPPPTALQIAFTREGLEALEVPPSIIVGFSSEFISGMTEESRSRRLGDVGANAPEHWEWGYRDTVPHAVIMLFAGKGKLPWWRDSIEDASWREAFHQIGYLVTSDIDGREPFGFIDGVSQPHIDWDQTREVSVNGDQLHYGNTVSLGEFLLGYSNEYGRFTDRPILAAQDPGSEVLLDAPDQPGKDLGKNGTYIVLRQLKQDVRGFWQFLDKAVGGNASARYRLAEAMVGRRIEDGRPLMSLLEDRIPGVGVESNPVKRILDIEHNQFTYDSDPNGRACPLGAHIRRSNPRNPDLPGNTAGLISRLTRILGFGYRQFGDDYVASTRFHRLLRRGREYGDGLTPEEALRPAPPDDPERGLHFIAINANIQRQFEFIQNAWMMRTKFSGLTEESDPLLGNREPVPGCPFTNVFSLPQQDSANGRIMDVPQFITVRGGAYFFLPSLRALKYFSQAGR